MLSVPISVKGGNSLFDRIISFFRFRKNLTRLLMVMLASFGMLAVCSKSSFLYPMNDWVDVNCFFTEGRGILHGMMPYRDLYEQKGPLLYLLYALAGLISGSSFTGVWLLECLLFGWFLYLAGRIAETVSESRYAFRLSVVITAVLIPVSPAFSHGSSAEELFLPVLALSLLTVLKNLRVCRPLTAWQGVVLGLCAAAALWTKYTFCGLYPGLALVVIIWYFSAGHRRRLPRLILCFLAGFIALSGAMVLWFAARGALADLWRVYFADNLTLYGQKPGGIDETVQRCITPNMYWLLPAMAGAVFMLIPLWKSEWRALAVWFSALGLAFFTFRNGRSYIYYPLVFAVYLPLGAAALTKLIPPLGEKFSFRAVNIAVCVLTGLLLLGGPFIGLCLSSNAYLMKYEKKDMPQYRFAAIIRESEDRTLLNYGFLDGGFYFAADVLPSGPYFCTLNMEYSEMDEALLRSLREGKTAFVVTRDRTLPRNVPYELVDQADMFFEFKDWRYRLYRRVDRTSSLPETVL